MEIQLGSDCDNFEQKMKYLDLISVRYLIIFGLRLADESYCQGSGLLVACRTDWC